MSFNHMSLDSRLEASNERVILRHGSLPRNAEVTGAQPLKLILNMVVASQHSCPFKLRLLKLAIVVL